MQLAVQIQFIHSSTAQIKKFLIKDFISKYGIKHSSMDQVKFLEDSL